MTTRTTKTTKATTRESTITMAPHARGKRVWLQGKWLREFGFERGSAITVEIDSARGSMRIFLDSEGTRAVAGTPEKPIVDVIGAKVSEAFPGATAKVSVSAGLIIVRGE